VCVATHVNLSAEVEPGCPSCPDQVPVRSGGGDGVVVDELPHAVSELIASAVARILMEPDIGLPPMCLADRLRVEGSRCREGALRKL
jgi:hypothetical protein